MQRITDEKREKRREWNRRSYEKHKAEINARRRAARQANLTEVRAYHRAYNKKRRADPEQRAKDQARQRAYNRKTQARRSVYVREWLRQRSRKLIGRAPPAHCEICGEDRPLHADHSHKDGHGRGWICSRCNFTLGNVGDNISLLQKMIAYLTRHSGYQALQLNLPGI